ncbi:MAG: prenyltransferase/squalene oxidase repeat-containing protein [Pirellulaceae bacterium]
MAKNRRIIRKTHPARVRRVDDQLWPLVVAMVVLGGFLSGSVLAYLRLDDARWYANAWTWLIAIPLVIAAGLIAVAWTGSRLLHRTMQLAVVLGITVHVVLLVLAIETEVFHRVWVEVLASAENQPQRQTAKMPDYMAWQHDPQRRTERDTEQPVEMSVPEPVLESQPQQQTPPQPTNTELQPHPVPDPQETPQPNLVKRAEPNQSIPRQREEMSKLSRKETTLPSRPTQMIQLPDAVPRAERREDAPRPEEIGLRPQQQSDEPLREPGRQTPQVPESAPTALLARRQDRISPPIDASATPAMARVETRALLTPRADADAAGQPAIAKQTQPEVPLPHNTTASKQQTRAPSPRERVATPPRPVTIESPSRLSRRDVQQPAPLRDDLAQTPRSVQNRQPRVTTRPDLTSVVDRVLERAPSPSTTPSTEPAPTALREPSREERTAIRTTRSEMTPPDASVAANVAPNPTPRARSVIEPSVDAISAALPGRRPADATAIGSVPQRVSPVASEATANEPSRARAGPLASADTRVEKQAAGNEMVEVQRPSAEVQGAAPVNQTPMRQPRPTPTPSAPAVTAGTAPDMPPRRALREAPAAVSPLAAESPTRTASSFDQPEASAAPVPLVLNKSEAGAAGRGISQNLGSADPLPDSPATVASGSAQRARATQNLAAGPALAPQEAALVRNGLAGQSRPSAVLKATPLNPSLASGSSQPADLNANASAALAQAASNAERGRITASKGLLSVDMGPTTLVAEGGSGRASGGGQPQLSLGSMPETVPRAQPGRAPLPSLATDVVQPAPAAPDAVGGGQPMAVDVEASSNSTVAARPSPAESTLGAPAALGSGPVTLPSLSSTHAQRRDHDAADELPSLKPESSTVVARLARKAASDRQLPLDAGVADLSVGNASDHNDDIVPAQSIAANAAASTSEKQSRSSPATTLVPELAVSVDQPSAAGVHVADLAARAEAADAAPGVPQAGGGTNSPPRTQRGPAVATNALAEVMEVAGASQSSGHPDALPRNTQGPATTELASGLDAARTNAPAGGKQAIMMSDGPWDFVPGTGPSRREASLAVDEGPLVRDDANRGGPGKQANRIQLATATENVNIEGLPAPVSTTVGQESDMELALGDAEVGPVSRLAGPALPVDIETPVDVGGLDDLASVNVGLKSRLASEISTNVHLEPARFARNRVGGQPVVSTAAAIPTASFRRRIERAKGQPDVAGGAGPQTEDAIELGLVFLSKAQLPDGRWALDRFAKEDGMPQLASDSAATGLALLSFQGAGYHHLDFRYADVVRQGIEFLVKNQQPDGSLFVAMDAESNRVVQFYSHSIAALALCEAYGMTQDPALRQPAQRAIDYIVETQNSQRGGWRYTPRVSSDTSVTGWMMMALKSGQLADLEVPDQTFRLLDRWLDSAQASKSQPHLYRYNPFATEASEQRGGRQPTKTMSSVGLLMRLYLGWRRDNPAMVRGAKYLAQYPPAIGTETNPQRDTYYWYYATQVMFHMGGRHWQQWHQRLHPVLVDSQITEGPMAGSWDPQRPVPDRWAPFAGRLYVTTMNLLSLEVTYRHLPLYEDTAK